MTLGQLLREAEQGKVSAQFELGRRYHKGDEVTQNDQETAKWHQLTIERDFANLQENLTDVKREVCREGLSRTKKLSKNLNLSLPVQTRFCDRQMTEYGCHTMESTPNKNLEICSTDLSIIGTQDCDRLCVTEVFA